MKLIRKGEPLEESPGLLLPDGQEVDVSSFGEDYDEVFFETDGLERLSNWLKENGDNLPPFPEGERYGSPVARPSKIICIGLNYDDHARESGMEIPSEPVLFFKSTSAFCGPNDDLILPRGGDKTDWEVELAFVIGKKRVMWKKVTPWTTSQGTPYITTTVKGVFNSIVAVNG